MTPPRRHDVAGNMGDACVAPTTYWCVPSCDAARRVVVARNRTMRWCRAWRAAGAMEATTAPWWRRHVGGCMGRGCGVALQATTPIAMTSARRHDLARTHGRRMRRPLGRIPERHTGAGACRDGPTTHWCSVCRDHARRGRAPTPARYIRAARPLPQGMARWWPAGRNAAARAVMTRRGGGRMATVVASWSC